MRKREIRNEKMKKRGSYVDDKNSTKNHERDKVKESQFINLTLWLNTPGLKVPSARVNLKDSKKKKKKKGKNENMETKETKEKKKEKKKTSSHPSVEASSKRVRQAFTTLSKLQ